MSALARRATDTRFHGTLADRVRHARRKATLSQAGLAAHVGVVPSAVAQWESTKGTAPTVEHLARIAVSCNVVFEWLATGRGDITPNDTGVPAAEHGTFARDLLEERLLVAFRRVGQRKRDGLVVWLEEFLR
jgi:transcriptional regulator with XRE-family HTH domain